MSTGPEGELGSLLYPYQQRWLRDQGRFKVGMFARQTGKTFTTTFELTEDCQIAQLEGRRTRWVILSRGERQAKEAMLEGVQRHCQAFGALVTATDYLWEGDAGSHKALEVSWSNGSRITALPANPDTARGFSANVFLDEFAFHQDSREIWKALFPVISNGYKLRVTSTPNGKGNKFYELMTDHGLAEIWSRHVTDIYQAVADGLPRDLEMLRRGLNDEDAWAQEYELKWLDEASAYLSFDLIASCETDEAGIVDGYLGGHCYVGIDIGRRHDLFVIEVLERIGDVLWQRCEIALPRAAFMLQDAALAWVMKRFRVVRVSMDQTGMGEKPVEDAKRRYGDARVVGVIMSAPAKLDLAVRIKTHFEDRHLRIQVTPQPLPPELLETVPALETLPAPKGSLRHDLHAVKKETGATGIPRFVADSDDTGHADRFWALALAVAAADVGFVEFDHLSDGQREGSRPAQGFPVLMNVGFGVVGGNSDWERYT